MTERKNITGKIIVAVLVIIVLLEAVLLGLRIGGMRMYTVLSGSMEPTYKTGSVIYVKDVETSDLKEGDVITFMLSEDTIVTHRITEVVPDEKDQTVLRFRTKGDANDAEDGTLTLDKNVIGTPVFAIPYLGYVANFIQRPPGSYMAIAFVAVLIILVLIQGTGSQPSEEGKNKDRKEGGSDD